MFRHYHVILRELVFNTLPSYASTKKIKKIEKYISWSFEIGLLYSAALSI
jgi:hypothetical protein